MTGRREPRGKEGAVVRAASRSPKGEGAMREPCRGEESGKRKAGGERGEKEEEEKEEEAVAEKGMGDHHQNDRSDGLGRPSHNA